MSTKVLLKKSSITGKAPVVGDLSYGELAINYADGVLYYRKSDDTIQQIGGTGGTAFTYDSSAPSTPNTGDVWVDSDSGIQYIYIDDGDSSQWVELGLSIAEGIIPGGTTGQILAKASNANYDTQWVTPDSFSGYSGYSGFSGFSGYSGQNGSIGVDGASGYSGFSGISGYSGFSGISGFSGQDGIIGADGASGYSGFSGYSGTSGYSGSGISGFSGFSGYSGAAPTTPIYMNSTTISQNYTIGSGFNGFSVGPITVADGYSVTVASGQRWVVI